MSHLIAIVTSQRIRRCATARWTQFAVTAAARTCTPNARRSTGFAAPATTLRTRPRAVLPLRHPPLPHCPSNAAPARRRPFPSPATPSAEAPFRRSHRDLPGRPVRRRAERRPLQRARRRLPRAGFPDACRPGAPQRALGARQSVDVPHRASRGLSAAPSPRTAAARTGGLFPDPARSHAGPHGPHPQRLERHLLPGHGFPRRRARAQHFDRSERARRGRGAQAARGSLLPRHRRAGAAPGQRGSAGQPPNIARIAEVFDFARDYLGLAEGRGDRLRHRAAGDGGRRRSRLRRCWPC